MYIKKIEDFINDAINPLNLESKIIDILKESRGNNDDDEEVDSWRESLPALANILNDLPDINKSCQIVLEAKYAVEEKRADVVLIGTNNGRKTMIFIENKRWSNLEQYTACDISTVRDPYHNIGTIDHPSRQVYHYKKTMEYTNKYVQDNDVEIFSMVYMQNATLDEKQQRISIFDTTKYNNLLARSPAFTGEENNEIVNYIADRLTEGEEGLAEAIYSSEIKYSKEYNNILGNLFGNREQLLALLDEQQSALFGAISNAVNNNTNEKKLFIVEGRPGTGKTFVAMALLAYLYQNNETNITVKYIEKNRDPRKTLKNQMDVPSQAMAATLHNIDRIHDCLICDESHRMLETVYRSRYQVDERNFIERFIELSRVAVFFYDANQSVHVNDYVTKEKILQMARQKGIREENIINTTLLYQHRCRSADRFLNAVDRLLEFPTYQLGNIGRFSENDEYKVALVDDPRTLFDIIIRHNNNVEAEKSSRVLAGKGRTYGCDWKWYFENHSYDDCKSIAPLRDSNEKLFTWNFSNYSDTETFASDTNSVNLVGCIDTSQGLDFDYVGVIIAPDLIYDTETETIKVSIAGHQQEDPDTGRNNIDQYSEEKISSIIKNTYRVLLSRGCKGCYIYCCNENLQRYLSNFIETVYPDEVAPAEEAAATEETAPVAEAVHGERLTGVVKYVNREQNYAYIKCDNKDYGVSPGTIKIMNNPWDILVVGNNVTFTVYHGSKDYANDIRQM